MSPSPSPSPTAVNFFNPVSMFGHYVGDFVKPLLYVVGGLVAVVLVLMVLVVIRHAKHYKALNQQGEN
jgi:hypothetical protein